MVRTLPRVALILTLLPACSWDEGLQIDNLRGTIVVPREAATRDYNLPDGGSQTITGVPNIGPVFVGLYPAVQGPGTVQSYPHPDVGPLFDPSLGVGDAYPYGGTTVGTFRSACVSSMSCRVTTGRFVDMDALVSWYADTLGSPLTDFNGEPIVNGEYLRQLCYNLYEYTSDAELRLTAFEDRNDDGLIDEGDLDFVEREDGNFEAEFTFWQQEYFKNPGSEQGFTAWAAMETPPLGSQFDTCATGALGVQIRQYNELIETGVPQRDFLNRPSKYLRRGDWVSGAQSDDGTYGYIYQSPSDTPEIWLNHLID